MLDNLPFHRITSKPFILGKDGDELGNSSDFPERLSSSELNQLARKFLRETIYNDIATTIESDGGNSEAIVLMAVSEVERKYELELANIERNYNLEPDQREFLQGFRVYFSEANFAALVANLFTPQKYLSGAAKLVFNAHVIDKFLGEVDRRVNKNDESEIKELVERGEGENLVNVIQSYAGGEIQNTANEWGFGDHLSTFSNYLLELFTERYEQELLNKFSKYLPKKKDLKEELEEEINEEEDEEKDKKIEDKPQSKIEAIKELTPGTEKEGENKPNESSPELNTSQLDNANTQQSPNFKPGDDQKAERKTAAEELKRRTDPNFTEEKISNEAEKQAAAEEIRKRTNPSTKLPGSKQKIEDPTKKFDFESLKNDRFSKDQAEDTYKKDSKRLDEADTHKFDSKLLREQGKHEEAEKLLKKADKLEADFTKYNQNTGGRIRGILDRAGEAGDNRLDQAGLARADGNEAKAKLLEKKALKSNQLARSALDALPPDLKKEVIGDIAKQLVKRAIAFLWPFISGLLIVILVLLGLGCLIYVYCKPVTQVRDPLEAGLILATAPISAVGSVATGIQKGVRSPLRIILEDTGICKAINPNFCSSQSATASNGSGGASGGVYDCQNGKYQGKEKTAFIPSILQDTSLSKAVFYYNLWVNAVEVDGNPGPSGCGTSEAYQGKSWGIYQVCELVYWYNQTKAAGKLPAGLTQQQYIDYYVSTPTSKESLKIQELTQLTRLEKRTNVTTGRYGDGIQSPLNPSSKTIDNLRILNTMIEQNGGKLNDFVINQILELDEQSQAYGASPTARKATGRNFLQGASNDDVYTKAKAGCSGTTAAVLQVDNAGSELAQIADDSNIYQNLASEADATKSNYENNYQTLDNTDTEYSSGNYIVGHPNNPELSTLDNIQQALTGNINAEAATATSSRQDDVAELKSKITSGQIKVWERGSDRGQVTKDYYIKDIDNQQIDGNLAKFILIMSSKYPNSVVNALGNLSHGQTGGDHNKTPLLAVDIGGTKSGNVDSEDKASIDKYLSDAQATGLVRAVGLSPITRGKGVTTPNQFSDAEGHIHFSINPNGKANADSTSSTDSNATGSCCKGNGSSGNNTDSGSAITGNVANKVLLSAGHFIDPGTGEGENVKSINYTYTTADGSSVTSNVTAEAIANLFAVYGLVSYGKSKGFDAAIILPNKNEIAPPGMSEAEIQSTQLRSKYFARLKSLKDQKAVVLEIHHDDRVNGHSGLIPAAKASDRTDIENGIAQTFGDYSSALERGLAASKNGIALLEMDKLSTSTQYGAAIANYINNPSDSTKNAAISLASSIYGEKFYKNIKPAASTATTATKTTALDNSDSPAQQLNTDILANSVSENVDAIQDNTFANLQNNDTSSIKGVNILSNLLFSNVEALAAATATGKKLEGKASFYTVADNTPPNSTTTASGIPLSDSGFTAALLFSSGLTVKDIPFKSKVKVTNKANGKSVVVEITDTGGGGSGRVVDLTKAAFQSIGDLNAGLLNVTVEVVDSSTATGGAGTSTTTDTSTTSTNCSNSNGSSGTIATGQSSPGMLTLLEYAKKDSQGKTPDGLCLKHVNNYIDAVGFGDLPRPTTRLSEARFYADYLINEGKKYGITNLMDTNPNMSPYDAPAGAIIFVTAGSPGTNHATAGDISVADGNGHFYNGGEMGYSGKEAWKGNVGTNSKKGTTGKLTGVFVTTK